MLVVEEVVVVEVVDVKPSSILEPFTNTVKVIESIRNIFFEQNLIEICREKRKPEKLIRSPRKKAQGELRNYQFRQYLIK